MDDYLATGAGTDLSLRSPLGGGDEGDLSEKSAILHAASGFFAAGALPGLPIWPRGGGAGPKPPVVVPRSDMDEFPQPAPQVTVACKRNEMVTKLERFVLDQDLEVSVWVKMCRTGTKFSGNLSGGLSTAWVYGTKVMRCWSVRGWRHERWRQTMRVFYTPKNPCAIRNKEIVRWLGPGARREVDFTKCTKWETGPDVPTGPGGHSDILFMLNRGFQKVAEAHWTEGGKKPNVGIGGPPTTEPLGAYRLPQLRNC